MSQNNNCDKYADLLTKAKDVLLRAGDMLLDAWKKPRQVSHKARIDLVTDWDVKIENFLKAELLKIAPESLFLAEESSPNAQVAENTWIIDPIDGTMNFVHKIPIVAISVGFYAEGRVQIGLINMPISGELFTAQYGKGAYCNGEKISVSDASKQEDGVLGTGVIYNTIPILDYDVACFKEATRLYQGVRILGTAATHLAFLASGRIDGFFEIGPKPWDVAAGLVIVEEAGGKVSNYDGDKYTLDRRDIIASNTILHDGIVEFVNATKQS